MFDADLAAEIEADWYDAQRKPAIHATRICPEPGCGRPQHYAGVEIGWAHDALVDTWHCADPRKDRA